MHYIKYSKREILNLVNKNILICKMNLWKIILIKGKNFKNYIQNHITYDLNLIDNNKFKFCCNSDYNGKIYSFICLFYHHNNLFYIIKDNLYKNNLFKLNKYNIFSNINFITDHDFSMLGLIGKNSYEFLKNNIGLFENISESVFLVKDISILNLSNNENYRFILMSNKKIINNFIKNILSLNKNIYFVNDIYWIYFDLIDGYPIIDNINTEKFYPQELGMNNINSISFNKGCYMGQEIISKIHFLKLQKKTLCNLYGNFDIEPIIGDKLNIIEKKKIIKKIGTILFYIILKKKKILIQSIIPNKNHLNLLNIHNSSFYLSINKIFK